jgi:hypothetical protein
VADHRHPGAHAGAGRVTPNVYTTLDEIHFAEAMESIGA